ncbi:4867_t:CDS:1, partial [Gigaspora rosea]
EAVRTMMPEVCRPKGKAAEQNKREARLSMTDNRSSWQSLRE